MGICASALIFTACSSGNGTNSNATPEDIALGDSLATVFGTIQGNDANARLKQMLENPRVTDKQRNDFKKEEYLKGLELILTTDTTNIAFILGLQQGMQMYGVYNFSGEAEVPVDPKVLVAAFKEAFENDSTIDAMAYSMEFQKLQERVADRKQERAEEKARNSEEGKANEANGIAYIDSVKAQGYQTTASGLVYKITNPGDTSKMVGANDRVKIAYVGKHVNDSIFDQNTAPTYAMPVKNFVPGFTEGLQLLGEGGSAILVIPYDLAYGVVGRQPIGPMETLVFEVTVQELTPATAPKK